MRKILLATSALVLAAGAAQAADDAKGLKLEMSGYANFIGGVVNESDDTTFAATSVDRNEHDFETEVKVVVDAIGKGAGDFEYGARIGFWNGANNQDGFNGGENDIKTQDAYVYMGSNWGRVILGDHTGASDMFVYAPYVGLGQVDGAFSDFTSNATLAPFFPAYIDNEEVATKATYYTPVVSGFQFGISYIPQFYDYGQNVIKFNQASSTPTINGSEHPYHNLVEAGAQWQGTFEKVNVTASGLVTTGDAEAEFIPGTVFQDFTAWGVGGQVAYAGFTLGGSYYDAGDFLSLVGQNQDQDSISAGLTYEFGKYGVGVSYVTAQGYVNNGAIYVDDYTAYGVGGEYTWLPGLVTSADVVVFDQESTATPSANNDGEVFMISQRVNF